MNLTMPNIGLATAALFAVVLLMVALSVHLNPRANTRRTFGLRALFAAAPTLQELNAKLTTLTASAKAIQTAADSEGRALTAEEEAEIAGIMAAFDVTEKDIERREKIQSLEARVSTGRRVVAETAPVATEGTALAVHDGARFEGGYKTGASKGTAGFQGQGDFALAVRAAVGGAIDPRLRPLASAPSSQNAEGAGADGGYLVPPDFRTVIMQKVLGEDALLGRTDQQTTTSNSITLPVDETTPWQNTGGVQVFWEGEGTQFNNSKLALQSVTVRATKVAALVAVTDELLEDAPSLTAYLSKKVPDKLTYKINDALLNGDGTGKPLGILNSPALVTQAAEGGQGAGTVMYNNITKMWSRMYAPLRRNAVWVINQDIEPQLAALTVPTTGTSFSGPAYLPPGGLAASPNGTLMGRPIVYSEAAQGVGTPGDITLVDFSQYLALMKSSGMKQDVSIHLWFDYSVTAFRFSLRIGGTPWWSSPIVRAKSALPLSFAVALAAR